MHKSDAPIPTTNTRPNADFRPFGNEFTQNAAAHAVLSHRINVFTLLAKAV